MLAEIDIGRVKKILKFPKSRATSWPNKSKVENYKNSLHNFRPRSNPFNV